MQWTDEALAYFEKVPPFIRPMAQKGVEAYVRSHGYATVTLDLVIQAKKKMMGTRKAKKDERFGNIGELNRQTSRLHPEISRFYAKEGADPLRYAFDKKTAVHAGAGGLHLDRTKVMGAWEECAIHTDLSPRRTVYIHIPFCRGHCLFCGFYMYKLEQDSSHSYTDALLREIRQSAALSIVRKHPINAVYFGGGTPADLEAKDLERLLLAVRQYLYLANDCEITVEGRIDSFTDSKIDACIKGGANRFSLGVQTFNTEVRRQVGRRAKREEVLERLAKLCSLNQAAVVIDLIYGLPGQNMEIWEEDVKTFLEDTEIDGCDMYQLNVFQGGPLAVAIGKGRISPAADISTQAEMFSLGRRMAMNARLKRLSMCHWGRTIRERNIYNLFTRYGAACIPFGCGAGGRLHGHYFFQEGSLSEYYRRVEAGEKPIATAMRLPRHSSLFRDLVGQMEEGAVNLNNLSERYGMDLSELFKPLLIQWSEAGLIFLNEGWLELTEAGEFWNVNLSQAMIDYFLLFTKEDRIPGAMAL